MGHENSFSFYKICYTVIGKYWKLLISTFFGGRKMELMSLLKENKEQIEINSSGKVLEIPLDAIMPNPDQSR